MRWPTDCQSLYFVLLGSDVFMTLLLESELGFVLIQDDFATTRLLARRLLREICRYQKRLVRLMLKIVSKRACQTWHLNPHQDAALFRLLEHRRRIEKLARVFVG